jgi:hypothetical protein
VPIALLVGAPVAAQDRDAECAAALRVVTDGPIADERAQLSALATAEGCPGRYGALALATAQRRRRTVAASPQLLVYFRPWSADTVLVDTALSIAGDDGATTFVRVLGLRVLTSMLTHYHDLEYFRVGIPVDQALCLPLPTHHSTTVPGATSATDTERIRRLARRLEGSADAEVRGAANCLLNAWRRSAGHEPLPPLRDGAPSLRITNTCLDEYTIRNPSSFYGTVVLTVEGATDSVMVAVGPRPEGAEYSETSVMVRGAGILHAILVGVVFAAARSGNPGCPMLKVAYEQLWRRAIQRGPVAPAKTPVKHP